MRIEPVFQDGLKTLLKQKPLEDINVVMLCDHVKSNRQTFYYHFRDISDVVESIFLKAKVGYGKKMLDYESVLGEMIKYISSEYSFISSINKSYASDKLYSFMYSYFYLRIGNLLKNHNLNGKDITRYLATLSAHELTFWVANKRKEKQAILVRRLTTICHYLINQYQSDLIRLS